MGGLFDTLGLGSQALQAQQQSAQITGANVGNANAPGYHREDVHMTSAAAFGGVQTVSLQRAVDNLLEAQVNEQTANVAYSHGRTQGLQSLVRSVGDMSATGLGAAVNGFFTGWRQLTTRPEDQAVRADTLGRTQALVERVNTMANGLVGGQRQADAQIEPLLEQANVSIRQIAQLNVAIGATQSGTAPPAELQDKRDLAVNTLANLVGATSTVGKDGGISVFVGDVAVVSDDVAFPLTTLVDADTNFHHVTVSGTTQGSLDSRITAGQLGGHIALRDGDLAASLADLDQFVTDLTTAVNIQHVAGYGFDGVTARNLFASHTGVAGAAAALVIDPDVVGQPAALATASAVDSPGDNTVAAQITGLANARIAAGNTQTLSQSVAALVSGVGQTLSQAQFDQGQAENYLEQTQTLWQQANGVSLQDQMLQLTRYQSAFQATTKLILVVEEMMQALQRM